MGNILLYETMEELIGKNLKFTISIDKAIGIPDKFSFKTKCGYEWIEYPNDLFESGIVFDTDEPQFEFEQEHIAEITEELCAHMRFSTLGIQVWGMIEGKANKLTDKRKVAGMTWADLKETAMKPDYKK